jgi:hypothetical protein
MSDTYTTYCEYCGEGFSRRYYADKDKADHKRKCDKKRYLGGELEIGAADDPNDLLFGGGQ